MLELNDVGVRFGSTTVLRGVTLRVDAGEAVGIRGDNGSGKTTLLRVAATLLAPTSGSVRFRGVAADRSAAPSLRPDIGLIGHTPALFAELTIAENTAFAARFLGAENGAVPAALRTVGLDAAAARRVSECSFGMQRRAEFARLLVQHPHLVLFDEAHAGLDAAAAGLVEAVIDRVVSAGGAAVVVTHEASRLDAAVKTQYELVGGTLEGT